MRRSAFTLVELLVMLAIIALLAAFLFPVFARSRAKAHQAGCLSNQRQVGMALMQYLRDHDDIYHPAPYSAAIGGRTFSLGPPSFLLPYVRNGEVFSCPTEPRDLDLKLWIEETAARGGCLGGRLGAWPGPVRYVSCAWNRSLFGMLLSGVPRPSETSVLFDGSIVCGGNPPAYVGTILARPGRAPRHHEGLNVTYLDGHAGYRKARFDPALLFLGTRGGWVAAGGPHAGQPHLGGIVQDDGALAAP